LLKKPAHKTGGFYWERKLYQSEAFLSLNKNSMKVVIHLLDTRKREAPRNAKDKKGNKRKPRFINLDHLEIPYGALEKTYKINRSSIPAAIDELLAKGFIEIVHRGGAYKHDKSIYAWSDNYLMWSPGMKPFSKRPKLEKHGYQGRRMGTTSLKDRNGPAELN
jgi:hypothetical protein